MKSPVTYKGRKIEITVNKRKVRKFAAIWKFGDDEELCTPFYRTPVEARKAAKRIIDLQRSLL
jgi:hypothetical protein